MKLQNGARGLHITGGSATVQNCVINTNTAGRAVDASPGGGVFSPNSASLLFINSSISNNHTLSRSGFSQQPNGDTFGGRGGDGGGIYAAGGTLTLRDCQVINNTAGDGAPASNGSGYGAYGGSGGSGGGIYCTG